MRCKQEEEGLKNWSSEIEEIKRVSSMPIQTLIALYNLAYSRLLAVVQDLMF